MKQQKAKQLHQEQLKKAAIKCGCWMCFLSYSWSALIRAMDFSNYAVKILSQVKASFSSKILIYKLKR